MLADAVGSRCGRLAGAVRPCLEGCDDDDLDALICAVIARAARLGLTSRPRPEQLEAARREGWMHIPTADLSVIVAATDP